MASTRGAMLLPIVSKFDDRGVNEAKTGLDRLGGFARGAGTLLAGAFAGATIAAGAFAISSVRAADESWKVSKALDQAAKNAGVFGSTDADIQKATDALKDHAQKLGELTGIDDEVLLSMEKTWMAVPTLAGLGTAGIENLARVAADVAAGTGKDIESIGGAFVKVAGDGETAMSKLLRQGIVFTDEQKNTYQALLDNNDEIGAQTYLIDQLDKKYAGMGEAAASPLDRMNQMFQNLQETLGMALMPILEKLAPLVQDFIAKLTASPEFQVFVDQLGIAFGQLLDTLLPLMPMLGDVLMNGFQALSPILEIFGALLAAILPSIVDLTAKLPGWLDALTPLIPPMTELIENLLPPMVDLIGNLIDMLLKNPQFMDGLIEGMKGAAGMAKALGDMIKWVSDQLRTFNEMFSTTVQDALVTSTAMTAANPMGGSAAANYHVALNKAVAAAPRFAGKLASGGIIPSRPGGTSAIIGEGGQSEAVIPLDRLHSMMKVQSGGGSVYNINISTLKADASVGEIIVNAIKKYERTSGAVFVGA